MHRAFKIYSYQVALGQDTKRIWRRANITVLFRSKWNRVILRSKFNPGSNKQITSVSRYSQGTQERKRTKSISNKYKTLMTLIMTSQTTRNGRLKNIILFTKLPGRSEKRKVPSLKTKTIRIDIISGEEFPRNNRSNL